MVPDDDKLFNNFEVLVSSCFNDYFKLLYAFTHKKGNGNIFKQSFFKLFAMKRN